MSSSTRTANVALALGLGGAPELVTIVGGGGKSSLMFALGRELHGRVVMTTTTRIFASQMNQASPSCSLADENWERHLDRFESSLLVTGGVEGERAVGVPRELPASILARPDVDFVVAEADGSRMRPVKAPAGHEPVIPDGTNLLVVVVGIDALSGPIHEVAHRPELVSTLTGLTPEDLLTPESLAVLLTASEGGLKDVPENARVAVLINKVESPPQRNRAELAADFILREPRIERVIIGALQGDPTSGWQVRSR
jgi:molybdenum cofactor cytidylyltransferase